MILSTASVHYSWNIIWISIKIIVIIQGKMWPSLDIICILIIITIENIYKPNKLFAFFVFSIIYSQMLSSNTYTTVLWKSTFDIFKIQKQWCNIIIAYIRFLGLSIRKQKLYELLIIILWLMITYII